MHYSRKWAKANPIKNVFKNLKGNAKRRGHTFTITLVDFIELIENTGYINQRGRRAYALHIDRIDGDLGYVPGNLQIITNHENQERRYIMKKYPKPGTSDHPF